MSASFPPIENMTFDARNGQRLVPAVKLTAVFIIVLLFLVTIPLPAQSSVTAQSNGKLSGVVVDSNAAGIAKAKIVIEGAGLRHEVLSGDDGSYEFDLSIGTYKLSAAAEGFYVLREVSIEIRPNLVTKKDIALKGIVNDEDLVYREPIPVETPVFNPNIPMRKPLRKT